MRKNIKNNPSRVKHPIEWQIVIENIPANHPVIGMDHEYWAYSIFLAGDKVEEAEAVGSADTPEECSSMAIENLEILKSKLAELQGHFGVGK